MLRVLVIAESEADQRIVCGLADRVIQEGLKCEGGQLPELRAWTGVEPSTVVLRWKDIKTLAAAHRPAKLRTLGFRPGQSGGEDEAALHKALILAELSFEGAVRMAIASRDLDTRDPQARKMSHQAAKDKGNTMGWSVIMAAANPMIEAWLLHGFEAKSKPEKEALSALKGELGFDPTIRSQELDAQSESAKRSAKRVLGVLLSADPKTTEAERREQCWSDCQLQRFHQHGESSGVRDFLSEVATVLVPQLSLNPGMEEG